MIYSVRNVLQLIIIFFSAALIFNPTNQIKYVLFGILINYIFYKITNRPHNKPSFSLFTCLVNIYGISHIINIIFNVPYPLNLILNFITLSVVFKKYFKDANLFNIYNVNLKDVLYIFKDIEFNFYTFISCLILYIWSVFYTQNIDYNLGINNLLTHAFICLVFALSNALLEEKIFRQYFLVSLKTFLTPGLAIFIQGLLFGSIHYYGFPNGISGILITSLYGILMGRLYIKSSNLLPCILSHFLLDIMVYYLTNIKDCLI